MGRVLCLSVGAKVPSELRVASSGLLMSDTESQSLLGCSSAGILEAPC